MICREADAPDRRTAGDPSLCPICRMLFQWFLNHYAEVECREVAWVTPETTFDAPSGESLDFVQWLLEAEGHFGVTIPDRDAERMRSVGDYLRYIRLHGKGKGFKPTPGGQHPLWDQGLDG
jgi:acyl carrier protein